uniref:Uncharacterized protein n=1 Tax=Nelumbo nucifera TaxID=4432 RepID=A0A822XR71_NELNU|nr:TPA_asm: hypothetical protein HUJ06_024290 [Nelumbo nucifera]
MAAKYIVGATVGSFAVAYVFDTLIAENKIFGASEFRNYPKHCCK